MLDLVNEQKPHDYPQEWSIFAIVRSSSTPHAVVKEKNMSVEENKELVRRWYEEGLNNGDVSTAEKLFAPEFVFAYQDLVPWEQKTTSEDMKEFIQKTRKVWPDGRWTVDQIVGEGDTVAVAVTLTGIHTGQWGDETPTNRKGRVTMHMFLQFVDGKVVKETQPSGYVRNIFALLDGTLFKEQEES